MNSSMSMRSSVVGSHFSERLPQIVGTGGVWNSSNTVSCGTASLQFEKKTEEREEGISENKPVNRDSQTSSGT